MDRFQGALTHGNEWKRGAIKPTESVPTAATAIKQRRLTRVEKNSSNKTLKVNTPPIDLDGDEEEDESGDDVLETRSAEYEVPSLTVSMMEEKKSEEVDSPYSEAHPSSAFVSSSNLLYNLGGPASTLYDAVPLEDVPIDDATKFRMHPQRSFTNLGTLKELEEIRRNEHSSDDSSGEEEV